MKWKLINGANRTRLKHLRVVPNLWSSLMAKFPFCSKNSIISVKSNKSKVLYNTIKYKPFIITFATLANKKEKHLVFNFQNGSYHCVLSCIHLHCYRRCRRSVTFTGTTFISGTSPCWFCSISISHITSPIS